VIAIRVLVVGLVVKILFPQHLTVCHHHHAFFASYFIMSMLKVRYEVIWQDSSGEEGRHGDQVWLQKSIFHTPEMHSRRSSLSIHI
jgi:hypothetical protein